MKKLNQIADVLGCVCSELISMSKQAPSNVLIYYGWLNAFNSAQNSWNNEKVAQDLAKYNILVFGDGVQLSSHGDYANSSVIIPRIKELNPDTKIFGYVTVNQTIENFKTKVDAWDNLGVDGIFLDESGYDYGKTRTEFNERVQYVHNQEFANICFANAWNLDHILGIDNDPSYPNSNYNSDEKESELNSNDFCLLESYGVNTAAYTNSNGYESKIQWYERSVKAVLMRDEYGINLIGYGVINDDNNDAEDLFNFGYIATLMFALDGYGTSDVYYGASSAKTTYRTRPDITNMGLYWEDFPTVKSEVGDTDVYMRYLSRGRFKLDFSDGSENSLITKY